MVTILSLAFTAENGTEQERCTSPLMCTEQAPHCATPQPYFVPVKPTCSRITQSSGVSGSACTSRTLPLMLSLAMRSSPRISRRTFRAAVCQNRRKAVAPAWRQAYRRREPLAMPVWNRSTLSRRVDEPEWPRAFESARGAQHQVILPRRPDDLQADGQTVGREAARHGRRRLLCQVER